MSFNPKELIVQKYGGATLADPAKIKSVAKRISEQAKKSPLVVVVSAMGATTNQLIELAHQVSTHPPRREMDMLLSVGERISMSLMSMALNDLGCSAISFTGSQAGIMTDESHVNAFIIDVKPIRVQEALEKNKVVILAGFQGVSPVTKEITTLGRGGSDTSAVAMAGHFGAKRCEILKDVAAIFSADPKIVKNAKPISELTYDQLFDMTFWGAKVLHYRSVELARQKNVTLYIGPAATNTNEGTLVQKKIATQNEKVKALSVNSHETVLLADINANDEQEAINKIQNALEQKQISTAHILQTKKIGNKFEIYLTGPQEMIQSAEKALKEKSFLQNQQNEFCSVTLTYTKSPSEKEQKEITEKIKTSNLTVLEILKTETSFSILTNKKDRISMIQSLHELI